MSRFHNSDPGGDDRAFQDVLFNTIGFLVVIVVILLMLPHKPEESKDEQSRSRGNIRVEAYWPDEYNSDIDLWGQAPGLPPVGYSNMQGPVLNLVRDDLGTYADISGRNYEIMFSRGLPQGEYTFNLHWFGDRDTPARPYVDVNVLITINKDDSAGSKSRPKQIVATTVRLSTVGEEITVIRFKLDPNGELIQESMTSLHKPIRAMSAVIP